MTPAEIEGTNWDVVIVGTGMGGSTLGYALAKAGRRVLFIEKGQSNRPDNPEPIRREWAEARFAAGGLSVEQKREILQRGGRFTDELIDESGRRQQSITTVLGSGTGGSTALYGMVLERFFPTDFTPRQHCPDADGSTMPETWPIAYHDLSDWYTQAERLFRVRGTGDPLRPNDPTDSLLPPPPMTPGSAELFEHLQGKGLNPYFLHMAVETLPECETCIGYLCDRNCKNDAGRICLEPALTQHNAELLADCRVLELEANRTSVKRVICEHNGQTLKVQGKIVVLAAGALATPVLMQQSTSKDWPQGLSNKSGLVGRNLMRHCMEVFAVRTKTPRPMTGQAKEISFNDFYSHDGDKLGTVQSFGPLPTFEHIIGKQGFGPALARGLAPLVRKVWGMVRTNRMTFASLLEDYPYDSNCVLPPKSPSPRRQGMRMTYRMGESERRRLKIQRKALSEVFEPYHTFCSMSGGDNSLLAHVCGTVRFGDDPATSVLNADNRSHDVGNLYVVDGSFLPTSTGMNPSLTIAANALRVAERIDAQLE